LIALYDIWIPFRVRVSVLNLRHGFRPERHIVVSTEACRRSCTLVGR
jgi:hypothetical protein